MGQSQNGLMKGWQLDLVFITILSLNVFRIYAGNGVGLAELTLDAHNINNFHFSKEILYTLFASYIVPKGSPMVVSLLKL